MIYIYEPNLYKRVINKFKQETPKEFSKIALGNLKLQKIDDYLYFIEYYDWDYAKATSRLARLPSSGFGCSAVRKGNFYGRNFDYYYSEECEFIVHTAANRGRHASIGVAHGTLALSKEVVESYEWKDAYDTLPFLMMDGINDAGVICNINLVPAGDKGHTICTNPAAEKTMSIKMLVRFVLDHADSAKDAVEKIAELNWVSYDESLEAHWMIADATETYIVEFVYNEVKIFSDVSGDGYGDIPNDPIMTNFYIDGWDGTIVTGFDVPGGIDPDDTTLTAHAMGCERYEILEDGYSSVTTAEGMALLMHSVWYSNAYKEATEPFWYSELTGESALGGLTIYQNAEDFEVIKTLAIEAWENRERNGVVWHTMHSVVYDISNKKFTIWTQENSEKSFSFVLKPDVPFA